jgi:hypothetical protein
MLDRALRLVDGQLLAIVSDGAPVPAAASDLLLLPASAAAAMAVFGDASPLARAEIVYEKPTTGSPPARTTWRAAALAAAVRKQEAARLLREAGQSSEALPLLHASLVLLCRAAGENDPGEDPAALLTAVHGTLIPGGALTPGDAHALSRAADLSRAFAVSPVPAQDALVEPLLRDAADLAARLATSLAGGDATRVGPPSPRVSTVASQPALPS